jgi:glycosyltransferase involved in cell wall biosynthesis
MRVALFTDTLGDVNGVSRFIRTAAQHAHATGRSLTVLTSTRFQVPDAPNIVNIAPVAATAMPKYPNLEIVLPRRAAMAAAARALAPDVVHVSTPGPVGALGRAFARSNRLPLLGTYHTDFPAYLEHLVGIEPITLACRDVMSWFYSPFARVFSRSDDYAASLRTLGVKPDRIERLRPGIDLSAFTAPPPSHTDRGPARFWTDHAASYPGIRPASVKVVFVGRVSVEKNLPLLAQVWPAVKANCTARAVDVQILIVGDGPYRAPMARALDGHDAHFLGFRFGQELASIYAACDLMAFPSRTDTLGQVVMEAQACGLPVIITPDGGPKEVVRYQDPATATGLCIPATPAAWTSALTDLACDHLRRSAMGQRASEYIKGFTFAASFDHFWRIHEQAAATR